jgi:DNA mismatch endonuclease, patch repair protein
MPDVHTPEQRSRNMAAVKGRDTKPEMRVRSILYALGYRYRLHRKDLPGKPDIVLPRLHVAIFVNGCFWHSHDCHRGRVAPKTRAKFWASKRGETTERDARNKRDLRGLGWRVVVIWECQSKSEESLRRSLISKLLPRSYRIGASELTTTDQLAQDGSRRRRRSSSKNSTSSLRTLTILS